MHRSSGQVRHTRQPALEQCEDRILLSIAVEPFLTKAAPPHETASAAAGSRIVVLYEPGLDHTSRVFDDPFFFDAN